MSQTRLECRQGVAHLILDDPQEKVNTLGLSMLTELHQRLDELEQAAAIRAVVIRSAKPSGFAAGANIKELQAIAFSETARQAGAEAARAGQKLMDRIEDFPKPVVAAVHGAALGGGLELALAALARVVADDAQTQLGLPELKLGVIPGFGGTWRLPRLIGLARALTAILSSSNFDGRQALQCGLADLLCPREYLAEQAEQLALVLLAPGGQAELGRRRRCKRPYGPRLLELPGLRALVFHWARQELLRKTGGHYPAPLELIAHLQANWGKARPAFMELEAEVLGKCLSTPVARNLLRLFFLGQEAKKQIGQGKPARIGTAAVVGAGFMGAAIAIPLIRRANLPVLLKDANQEVLGRALKKLWDHFAKRAQRRQISPAEAQRLFHLATPVTRDAALRHANFVIEAVPELLELKKKIFSQLEAELPEEAVLASNTSTLPIAKLSQGARRPSRYVGMHFFSPAEVMPLVEIIPGPETTPETLATAVDLALKMGKTPVVVKDSPGFLVNRILLPYILEAAQMVEEGAPVSQVDGAALRFGMPVGPIKLMGEVGIPVISKVLQILQSHFGDHLPRPQWILRQDLEKAFLRDAKGKLSLDAERIHLWVDKADPRLPAKDVEDRLFHAMLNEAARCLDEALVAEAGLLDLAMILGTGFPPFRGGLLREADQRGLGAVRERGRELAARYGAWLSAPPGLDQRARFYPEGL